MTGPTAPVLAAVERAIATIDPVELAERRWSGFRGRPPERLALAEAFALPGDAVLVILAASVPGRRASVRLVVLLVPDGEGGLREAIEGEGPWRSLATAAAGGAILPSLESRPDAAPGDGPPPGPVAGALVCRPATALSSLVPGGADMLASASERPLGLDQSNSSAVVGERLLVKVLRRLQVGLDPDLELAAYLSEEAGFEATPRLAGSVELVTAAGVETVAIITEYLADAADAFEDLAERLTAWLLAPGEVAIEFATEVADELGRLTAGLHATLAVADAPGFDLRAATSDELRAWHAAALDHLDAAMDALGAIDPTAQSALRADAPSIAAGFEAIEATSTEPLVMRIHGDLHLGQLLRTSDGYEVIDFEGDPLLPIEGRRALASPLRDVATMLRSLDHVASSARRRAIDRSGGPLTHEGLDLDAWFVRARARFLAAYRRGLRSIGSAIEVDEALLHAFELDKECLETVYAATYLPSWLYVATAGMHRLVAPPRS